MSQTITETHSIVPMYNDPWLESNGLVGGNHNSDYDAIYFDDQWASKGIMVKTIDVWHDTHCLKGIRVRFTDENSKMYGNNDGENRSFTFARGELCTSFRIWGNGVGTRTGKIRIETDKGRSFECGKDTSGQTSYSQKVGSGLLAGLWGYYNTSMDGNIISLSTSFLKPIRSITSEITYDDLPIGMSDMSQLTLDSGKFSNKTDETTQWELNDSTEKTISQTWSQSSTETFGVSMSIKAGIPEIVDIEAGAKWELSNTSNHETSETYTKVLDWNYQGTVKPHKTAIIKVTAWEGNTRLYYTSKVTVTVEGGQSFTFKEDGQFAGVAYSDTEITNETD
ncbi:hypothetical protein BPAE_0184g00010 [Botrytis paeoniae]|uniref:Jacalin-type lectin domain-containing protein n=1 Tax=Botrytis paeoniae TaxID=278948 RepID=A0A4Z1FFI9_9HELO|nr:hypothetical protein BPAE_0184g00010 [Botrytis paeoniae]